MAELAHRMLTTWFESIGSGSAAYALIDMAAMPSEQGINQALSQARAAGGVAILQDARPQAARATPWLLPLGAPNEQGTERLTRTLNWAQHGPCVTWLASHLPVHDLAARLRQRTQAQLPQNHPVLLRCYDPRVLPELHRALRPAQAESYWALGHTWAYLDRTQQVQTIALEKAPDIDLFEPPLQLDQSQFEVLLAASEVDSVMPELAREAPDAFLALPADQRTAFTRRCLKLADDWGVQAFAQRVMVGVLALKLGEDFHRQAAWAPWINQLKQGKIDLIQTIEKACAT